MEINNSLLGSMETSIPMVLRKHHVWTGSSKCGKTKTATILKRELEKVGVTLYHLDLDLARGVDHYPNSKNIKLTKLSDVYAFMRNAETMYSKGELKNAVLLIDPLNPIFDWMVTATIEAYGSDNFIADTRIRHGDKELNALSSFYMQAKDFIANMEKWFPFVISVIHLKRSEIAKAPTKEGDTPKVFYDSFALYGQMRGYMMHKVDGSILFGSIMDVEKNFITTINKAQPHVINGLGMRDDPELHIVDNSEKLIKYYCTWLPKQIEYLEEQRVKLNKEK